MKRVMIPICCAIFGLSQMSPGMADEPKLEPTEPQFDAAREKVKVFAPLVGEWFWDEWTAPKDYANLDINKGDKFKRTRSYRMDLVSSVLVGEVVLANTAGKRLVVAKSLSGWDAASGKFIGMEFWAGPFGTWYAGKHEWTAEGNSFTMKTTGSLNKDTASMEIVFMPEGKDVLIAEIKKKIVSGRPAPTDGAERLTRLK